MLSYASYMSKHIFITGVSSGLGYGLAKTYLERGDQVYGCSRRVPEELVKMGLEHAQVDLADAQQGELSLTSFLAPIVSFDLVIAFQKLR